MPFVFYDKVNVTLNKINKHQTPNAQHLTSKVKHPTMLNHLKYLTYIFFLIFFSCNNQDTSNKINDNDSLKKVVVKEKPISKIEEKMRSMGLVDIHSIDTSIVVEIKYSTLDNFMKRDVYGDFDKAYLQKEVAESLVKAQKYLNDLKKDYRLIIYDAARPLNVQQFMWDSSGVSNSQKINYLSNPAMGSIHNYGCAVDIGILDDNGKVLDMGTPFDCMDITSGTADEAALLKQGKLTQQQIENRKLLRKVMCHAGFFNVESEWWHFNFCSIQVAKSKYKIIE